VVPFREGLFAAVLAARAATNDAAQDGVLQLLPRTITIGKSISILRLTLPQRRALVSGSACIGAELDAQIARRERGCARLTGSQSVREIRTFVRRIALQIWASYARIASAKSFVFKDITYIIGTKHLRSGNRRRSHNQRLQRDARLLRNHQRIRNPRFDVLANNLGKPRLRTVYPLSKRDLSIARLFEVGRKVWIGPKVFPPCHRAELYNERESVSIPQDGILLRLVN
jgi:hypothetical protein